MRDWSFLFYYKEESFSCDLGKDWLCVLVPNWGKIFKKCELVEGVHAVSEENYVERFTKEFPQVFSKCRSESIKGLEAFPVLKDDASL